MIDFDKKYRTRSGQKVKLIGMSPDATYPIIGVLGEGQHWFPYAWTVDGSFAEEESEFDLVEEPKEYSGWVNVFEVNGTVVFSELRPTLEDCIRHGNDALARIPITFTEGECAGR